MQLPDFILSMPALDLPFDDSVVETRAIRSDGRLAVFFIFHQDFTLPPHSHKGQWGTVLQGQVALTVEGVTTTYRPGESYAIPSGAEHGGFISAGTTVIDVFEEPDRYPLRG